MKISKEALTVEYSIRGYNALGAGNASSKFTNNPFEEGRTLMSKTFGAAVRSATAKAGNTVEAARSALGKSIWG